ncbi:hypothetical protein DSCOOX_00290 [Desulfosarcina ovata subsp. ovata]|uniref:Uncharacterized protein n=2 Tax=Desulfosarcina ovata TaxID=83564 RepID=A0A5K8A2V2_9BACT|nr:hypothetical protein DSCOOX_00290 [Desulfosarcina ovata subsp. ovata]
MIERMHMTPIISDPDWHQRAQDVLAALRKRKMPLTDDFAEDITALINRAHRVKNVRELHERILGRLDRLCDRAQSVLLPKMVVSVTGASGGIGKETILQVAKSRIVKKVIGLVRTNSHGPATGNVMDLTDRMYLEGPDGCRSDIEIRTYNDFAAASSDEEPVDVFIHTIGQGRKPAPINPDTLEPIGKPPTREELLSRNQAVLKQVVACTHGASPKALNIFVTNPIGLRLMQVVLDAGVNANKILGFGGELDSARFRHFIWQALEAEGHGVLDVCAQVIGEHNNNMIPLQGSEVTFVNGVTLSIERCVAEGLLSAEKVRQIMDRTIQRGIEIVESQGSSAIRSPARGLVVMFEKLLCGKVVNGLSYRPDRNGQLSFVGGPVRLQNGLTLVPEPLEHPFTLTRSEKKEWVKAMQANCIGSDQHHPVLDS